MSASKYRQRRTLECALGVSNEWEHCARPETEQQKSPLTNQLERRPDRTQLSYAGLDAAATWKTNRALFFLAQRSAVAGDSMKQQALLRAASSAGRHSAQGSKEAAEIWSRSPQMPSGDCRQHFGPQTGGPFRTYGGDRLDIARRAA